MGGGDFVNTHTHIYEDRSKNSKPDLERQASAENS